MWCRDRYQYNTITITIPGPSAELPNVLWGDYFYTNPVCQSNPTDPACKSSTTTGTTTGAPSGSLPADSGSVKNDICTTSPDAPFCKSSTTTSSTTFDETQKKAESRFSVGFDAICQSNNPTDPDCKSSTTPATTTTPGTTAKQVEVSKTPDGKCPAGSSEVGFGGKTGSNAPSGSKCISDNPPAKTTTTPLQLQHATTTKTVLVTKTNINNDQVTVRNDGGLTVRTLDGAVTPTADCAPQSATTVLGPSPMENGKARILAAFDPCILTSGKVLLNLPDEKGIQLVGAKIQDGQTTQSAIVPIQRISSTAPGQAQYFIDLTEQSTGLDLVSGNPVNLGGNVNALLLMNLGGENVQLSADNKVNMDAALRQGAITATATQPTLASQSPVSVGGS